MLAITIGIIVRELRARSQGPRAPEQHVEFVGLNKKLSSIITETHAS